LDLFGTPALIAQPHPEANPAQSDHTGSPDISGTWIAKMSGPMGEIEIVYKLKVDNGKITGTQSLPFGIRQSWTGTSRTTHSASRLNWSRSATFKSEK
jgi:hypothetical protein